MSELLDLLWNQGAQLSAGGLAGSWGVGGGDVVDVSEELQGRFILLLRL